MVLGVRRGSLSSSRALRQEMWSRYLCPVKGISRGGHSTEQPYRPSPVAESIRTVRALYA